MRAVIADDDPVATAILSHALRRWGIDVTTASEGTGAWRALAASPAPELAIIDWMMPGLDGIEICRRIRQEPRLAGMYVLLLTGRGSRADLVVGLDAGADDYMIKPIDTEELRARVQVGMRVAGLQARLADRVSDLQTASDHLARLVSTDVLTDVYTRRSWFERAATEFSRSQRYGRGFSLMVIERSECRQSDIVGRLGGEEFAVLTPETSQAAAQNLAGRIGDVCRKLIVESPSGPVRCSCSIGIAEFAPTDDSIETALRRADAALYDAKRSGRDCWKSYVASAR